MPPQYVKPYVRGNKTRLQRRAGHCRGSKVIGFRGYLACFFLLFVGRFISLFAPAWMDRDSLKLQFLPQAIVTTTLTVFVACWFMAGSVYAEAEADLAEESMNPLSTVIALPFENNTLFNVGPAESTVNSLNVKPIFPVDFGNWNLINRVWPWPSM